MSRAFAAVTDRVVAPAPAVWPGAAGSIFIRVKADGWITGDGTDRVFWSYGYTGPTLALLSFQRYLDNKLYVGWYGDSTHGGDQRIVLNDEGFYGGWSSHLYTWDPAGSHYYRDGTERGARVAPLAAQVLSGQPTSNVTIGNYNAALGSVDARSTLATFARWDRVLTPVEIEQLRRGAHALDLAVGLVECIDLGADTPERDLVFGTTYTVTGTTTAPEPDRVRLPSEVRRLAKQYEPILLFHPQETFRPIDPKRYIERCALWPAATPFTDKNAWGVPTGGFPKAPRLARGQVAAIAGEASGDARWIGTGAEFGVGTLDALPLGEHFLDLVGWDPLVSPPNQVTATSDNRYAAMDTVSYDAALGGSRPWYYVEYLDHYELGAFIESNPTLYPLIAANASLNDPRLLLYYFLYPRHDEGLEGCDTDKGTRFGTYAGEWACVALLLEADGTPRFVGVSSRNGGAPNLNGRDDRRIGMTAMPWSAVDAVTSGGNRHAKIFVSRSTHGHYTSGGSHPVVPFTPGFDVTSGSCGEVEGPAAALETVVPGEPADMVDTIAVLKLLIPVVGFVWLLIESTQSKFGTAATTAPGVPDATVPDTAAGGLDFGWVLRPQGLDFPELAHATHVEDWTVDRYSAEGRFYDCVVNRPSQLWWTPRRALPLAPFGAGFAGRWGPRVTDDPYHRRAGGKCPDFAMMFLEAIAVAMNK